MGFTLLVSLIFSAPIFAGDGSRIDIVDVIKKLMISKAANYNSQDKVSVSEAFEGCIFEPFELLSCSEIEKNSKYPSTKKSLEICEEIIAKSDIYNQPLHWKTKCNLTYKGKYIVDKNLPRDYRMDIEMHGQEGFVYAVKIFNRYPESKHPNHLYEILKDQTLTWIPIRCENVESTKRNDRLYLVSAAGKQDLYIDFSEGEYSEDSTRWGALTVYWELPKTIMPSLTGWTNKCSENLNGLDLSKGEQTFVPTEMQSYFFPKNYTEKVLLDDYRIDGPPKKRITKPHATAEEFRDYINSHTTRLSKLR